MKKLLLLATATLLYGTGMAQVADRDQWTCQGVHENLYDQLNAGKTVVIAMQGLDCSGCNGNAPHLDSFATNNKSKVRVWSALQLMAGSGGTCAGVATWIQTHGYGDVFTFLDSTNYWMTNNPGAEWLVIDPMDKKIKYKGYDRNQAFVEARKIFDPTSVSNVLLAAHVSIFPNPATDHVTIELKQKGASVRLYTIDGRALCSYDFAQGKHDVEVGHLPNGIYILDIVTDKGRLQSKIVKQ